MQKFPNLRDPYHFLATLGGLGLVPVGPGTVGSIFGWLIFIVLSHFFTAAALLTLTFFVIIFSIYISTVVTKDLIEKDHKSIVIDEMAGIWLAMIPVIFIASSQYERTIYAMLALIIFRIFDIFKPFPISYIDKNFKNGLGVVLDDLMAAIFAAFFSSLITIYLI
jgi:phosphatidylglycerophosphatase A|tara:strand:+ start:1141 stop:1635 length:495 start_codon:yes stop_codon:yes gene_type:complete